MSSTKPNILMIFTNQFNANCLGCLHEAHYNLTSRR